MFALITSRYFIGTSVVRSLDGDHINLKILFVVKNFMGGLGLSWDLKPGAATANRIVVRRKLKQYAAVKNRSVSRFIECLRWGGGGSV